MFPLPSELGVEILRTEVGSTLHGTGLPDGEDHDEMGIFIEHPRLALRLGQPYEQYQFRTAELAQLHAKRGYSPRSQVGDTDLCVYTLRKWARLAMNGNPTILLPLYAPKEKVFVRDVFGDHLRQNTEWFWSARAADAFLGYMQTQRQRMTGERGGAGRVRKQPDGEVDWKYAMHMLRLGHQGIEYIRYGKITLPMEINIREFLKKVRRGEFTLNTVIAHAEVLENSIRGIMEENPMNIPDEPNIQEIERFVVQAHLSTWRYERWVDVPK